MEITQNFLIELFVKLYTNRYIQTLWNAESRKNREKGWELKGGLLAPWFFNMRTVGSDPELFYQICQVMAAMVSEREVGLLIGVEMAGVPLVGGVGAVMFANGHPQRIAYTRPLPGGKVRTPEQAAERLAGIGAGLVDTYGQKSFVEGRINHGDRMAIVDDMSTNLGSKQIARQIALWEAEQRGIQGVICDMIFYFLDRGDRGVNKQEGLDFANNTNLALRPAALDVMFAIGFDDFLPHLEGVMTPDELAAIQAHQSDKGRFARDIAWHDELIAMARSESH